MSGLTGYSPLEMQRINAQQLADPQRQDGSLTQRIRSLAGCAEEHEIRLRGILRNLRVPPPEPNTGFGGAIHAVRTTMDEHLQRHENAQTNIASLLAELEGLIG